MKFSDIKTFKDLLASFFVLKFDPEDEPKPKRARKKKVVNTKQMIQAHLI